MGARFTVKKGASVLWWAKCGDVWAGLAKYIVAYHAYSGGRPKGWVVKFIVTDRPGRFDTWQTQFTGNRYDDFRRDVAEWAEEFPTEPLDELPAVCQP